MWISFYDVHRMVFVIALTFSSVVYVADTTTVPSFKFVNKSKFDKRVSTLGECHHNVVLGQIVSPRENEEDERPEVRGNCLKQVAPRQEEQAENNSWPACLNELSDYKAFAEDSVCQEPPASTACVSQQVMTAFFQAYKKNPALLFVGGILDREEQE